MIAIITSTMVTETYSYFSKEERIKQTIHTINRLIAVGFSKIFLFDNSIEDINNTIVLPATSPPIEVHHSYQFTFDNKGLNEALLILNNLRFLPESTPIFKLSARYYPNENFNLNDFELLVKENQLIGVGGRFNQKNPFFNTRAYFIKDIVALESILRLSIQEMLSYSKGIHGVRSFFSAIKSIYKPVIGNTYQLSLEQAFARVAQQQQNFLLLKKIHIEGYIAGSDYLEFINE